MTMMTTVLLRRLIKEELRWLNEVHAWTEEHDDDPSESDDVVLDKIITFVTGGSAVKDDDIVREVIEVCRASTRKGLRSMSDEEIKGAVLQYLRDMESSGDWD